MKSYWRAIVLAALGGILITMGAAAQGEPAEWLRLAGGCGQ